MIYLGFLKPSSMSPASNHLTHSKVCSTIFFLFMAFITAAQDKHDYIAYNKLTEVEGTGYVIASVENWGKIASHGRHLLFIDTKNGDQTRVEFSKDAFFGDVKQIKIDSLGINVVLLVAQTINLDQNKSIDWNDPQQVIILSTDGKQKAQITDDRFFTSTWTVNRQTGTIVIAGHYDSNNNGKYDKTDKHEIVLYDLKAMKKVQ